MTGNKRTPSSPSGFLSVFVLLLLTCPVRGARQLVVEGGSAEATIECYLSVEETAAHETGKFRVLWKWKPHNETNWLPIPNDAEIHFSLFDETRFKTNKEILISTVELLTVSIYQTGLYVCYFEESDVNVDETQLYVGYPPDSPARRSCETNGFITKMTCYWDPGRETYLPTTYRLMMTVDYGVEKLNNSVPALKDQVTINVEKSYLFLHYLRVEAANELDSALSDVWSLNPCYTVKPDPPTDVYIVDNNVTTGDTKSSVVVSWQPPDKNTLLDLSYAIRRRKSNRADSWKQNTVDSTTFQLVNLDAYTYYDIQVAAMPAPSSFFSGYTSDWSQTISHRTALLAPSELLQFSSIVAVKAPPDSNSGWKIETEWSRYKGGSNQPGFYYEIIFKISGVNNPEKLLRNNYTFYTSQQGKAIISGRHCNRAGCSPSTSEQVDLNLALSPVNNIELSLTQKKAIVTWNETNKLNETCVVKLCVATRITSSLLSSKDIVTDEQNKHICSENNFMCSDGEARIDISISPCRQYQAFVFRVLDKGIFKIMTPSVPSLKQTIDPPVIAGGAFEAHDTSDNNFYRISTSWRWKESLCNMHDHLQLFVLYSPINGSECRDKVCPPSDPFNETISTCSASITEHDVTTNLYGATLYDLELDYCCKTLFETSPLCFRALASTDTAKTRIGAPEQPQNLNWEASDPLLVYWTPPTHINGDLDGYRIQYGKVKNSSDSFEEVITFDERYIFEPELELPIKCEALDEKTLYQVRVSAYNLASGLRLYGPHIEKTAALCQYVNPDSIYSSQSYAAIVAGICSCFGVILVTLGLGYCQRNRLKKMVRKYVWPSVPSPNVLIHFSESVDKDGKRYKNVYDKEKTFANAAFHENSRNGDDISYKEVPDILRYCACHTSMENCICFNTADEYSVNDQSKKIHETDVEDTTSGNMFDKNDGVFSSNLKHFFESDKDILFVNTESCQSTATWRSMLYPSFQNDANKTMEKPKRSQSFSGSSGESFNAASYMKNCSGTDTQILVPGSHTGNSHDSSSVILYSKLSSNPDLFSTCKTSGISGMLKDAGLCGRSNSASSLSQCGRSKRSTPNKLRCGLSWYDRQSCSSEGSTSLPAGLARIDSCCESHSSESEVPYVSIPNASGVIKVQGATLDSTSDNPEVSDQENKKSESSPTQSSLESLELLNPIKSRNDQPWDSTDFPYTCEMNSSNSSSTGYTKIPLLKCYSPPPTNGDSYITMNEVLTNFGRNKVQNSEENVQGQQHKHFTKFEFDVSDKLFPQSSFEDSVSYVLQASPEKNTPRELSYADFDHVQQNFIDQR